jgi:hypothetical protein
MRLKTKQRIDALKNKASPVEEEEKKQDQQSS